MVLGILYALLTIFCVVFALKKQKMSLLVAPFAALFIYFIIKIAMVPMPFWETVQFIFSLK